MKSSDKEIEYYPLNVIYDVNQPDKFKVKETDDQNEISKNENSAKVDVIKISGGTFDGYYLICDKDKYIFASHPVKGYEIHKGEFRKSITINYDDFKVPIDNEYLEFQIATEILIDYFKSFVEEYKKVKPIDNDYSLIDHTEKFFALPKNIFELHTHNQSTNSIAEALLEKAIDKLKRDYPQLTKSRLQSIRQSAEKELKKLEKQNNGSEFSGSEFKQE